METWGGRSPIRDRVTALLEDVDESAVNLELISGGNRVSIQGSTVC